jgi:hypothetical protein
MHGHVPNKDTLLDTFVRVSVPIRQMDNGSPFVGFSLKKRGDEYQSNECGTSFFLNTSQ